MANLWPPIGSWVYEIIPKEPAPKDARTIPEIILEKKRPQKGHFKIFQTFFFLGGGGSCWVSPFSSWAFYRSNKKFRVDRRRGVTCLKPWFFTLLWKVSPKVQAGPLPVVNEGMTPINGYKWFRTLLIRVVTLIYNYTPLN